MNVFSQKLRCIFCILIETCQYIFSDRLNELFSVAKTPLIFRAELVSHIAQKGFMEIIVKTLVKSEIYPPFFFLEKAEF
jgi:hypothetical protein